MAIIVERLVGDIPTFKINATLQSRTTYEIFRWLDKNYPKWEYKAQKRLIVHKMDEQGATQFLLMFA